MAQLRLDPPEAFNFRSPDEWPHWKKRFQQFRLGSGLFEDSNAKQVSTLLYCMGQDAEETLASTNITATDREQYHRVLAQFDSFYKVRRNVIFERAKFNRRTQQRVESVEQFITALYHLAETCEHGALRDEMLRDRIVVGITDSSLSERLQMIKDLTLVRQREAVHEQQLTLKGQSSLSLTWMQFSVTPLPKGSLLQQGRQ